MSPGTKIGIIICDRYRRCAGGKCFRSMRNREGAFSIYNDEAWKPLVAPTMSDAATRAKYN